MRKNVTLIEATVCVDYIQMLVSIQPSLSFFIYRVLNKKSCLMLLNKQVSLKYKYGNSYLAKRILFYTVRRKNEVI